MEGPFRVLLVEQRSNFNFDRKIFYSFFKHGHKFMRMVRNSVQNLTSNLSTVETYKSLHKKFQKTVTI